MSGVAVAYGMCEPSSPSRNKGIKRAPARGSTRSLPSRPLPSAAPSAVRGPVPVRSAGDRRRSFEFGIAAERQVAHFLRAGGYDVLGCRFRERSGEVDLIVARDDTVAFVEVKARRKGWDGLEAVDRAKQRRLSRAANEWLASHPAYGQHNLRFDIALVWPGTGIEYLENAFEATEERGFVW